MWELLNSGRGLALAIGMLIILNVVVWKFLFEGDCRVDMLLEGRR